MTTVQDGPTVLVSCRAATTREACEQAVGPWGKCFFDLSECHDPTCEAEVGLPCTQRRCRIGVRCSTSVRGECLCGEDGCLGTAVFDPAMCMRGSCNNGQSNCIAVQVAGVPVCTCDDDCTAFQQSACEAQRCRANNLPCIYKPGLIIGQCLCPPEGSCSDFSRTNQATCIKATCGQAGRCQWFASTRECTCPQTFNDRKRNVEQSAAVCICESTMDDRLTLPDVRPSAQASDATQASFRPNGTNPFATGASSDAIKDGNVDSTAANPVADSPSLLIPILAGVLGFLCCILVVVVIFLMGRKDREESKTPSQASAFESTQCSAQYSSIQDHVRMQQFPDHNINKYNDAPPLNDNHYSPMDAGRKDSNVYDTCDSAHYQTMDMQ